MHNARLRALRGGAQGGLQILFFARQKAQEGKLRHIDARYGHGSGHRAGAGHGHHLDSRLGSLTHQDRPRI